MLVKELLVKMNETQAERFAENFGDGDTFDTEVNIFATGDIIMYYTTDFLITEKDGQIVEIVESYGEIRVLQVAENENLLMVKTQWDKYEDPFCELFNTLTGKLITFRTKARLN